MKQITSEKELVVIFDCDGTLVDTFKLIEQTVILTFKKMLPNYNLTLEEAYLFFGPFLNDSFSKYAKTKKEIEELVDCYRIINDKLMSKYIYAYDGILELLTKLKKNGYRLAIVSNKVTDAVEKSLKLCNIDSFFDLIVGAEKLEKAKPNPSGIYQVLEYFNSKKAIMIGDTIIDIETGQNAKIKTIGVTWCKTDKQSFIKANANYIVNHPLEIIKVIEEEENEFC